MENYVPPYEITNKILRLTASVSEKTGRIRMQDAAFDRPHLRRNSRIRSIHSSLRIEANSLSLNQVRDVIDGRQVLGTRQEIQEVKNAYEAYAQIPDIDPYSTDDLLRIHGIMTKYILDESGAFRHGEEGVFSGGQCIFMAPPARLVPELIENLFCWMRENRNDVHPLILAAVFHYEFVFIHPFADGNGRLARLWHTVLLAKWEPVYAYIPLESRIEKFQDAYYEVIASCHKAGSSTGFIEFMLERLDEILEVVLQQTQDAPKGLLLQESPYVNRLLAVMEEECSYSSAELLELLHLRSKETFRKNYLNPAMEAGLVRMTIPEKPRSRNQRYVYVKEDI